MPDNNYGYDISWARCCRNASIVNIINPNITGTTITVRIPPTASCDNSPVFQTNPGIALCLGLPYTSFNTALDPDGDSISYHLVTPYQGGGTNDPIPEPVPPPYNEVFWNPPYNLANILGGNPAPTINNSSGLLTVNPDINGQFAIGIAAKSWRNGLLLTEIRRDFQLNVVTCLADLPPVVTPPSGPQVNDTELIFFAGQENCFSFNISDSPDNFLVFTASGDPFNPSSGQAASYNGAGYGNVVGNLCWAPDCSMAGFEGSVIISSNDNNNCPAPNYTYDTFLVKVIPPTIKSPEIRCVSELEPGSVMINWISLEPIPGFSRYEIFRSSLISPESIVFTSTDSTQKSWIDTNPGNLDDLPTYRIQAYFNCPNDNPTLPSSSVSLLKPTINLTNPVQAIISWNPYTGWPNPELTLWQYPNQSIISDNIEGSSFTWNNCDFEGTVRLTGTDPLSGCEMRSAESDSFRMYLDPPGNLIGCTASVLMDNQGVLVKWLPIQNQAEFTPILARKNPNESDFQIIHELTSSLTFMDLGAKPDQGVVEYKLGFINPCGISGDWSDPFHTSFLSLNSQNAGFQQSWTPSFIFEGVEEYEIQIRETEDPKSPWLVLNRQAADDYRTFTDYQFLTSREIHCYRIRAYPVPAACTTDSWSNTACIRPSASFTVPGAFSPNGDGLNDFYKIPTYAVDQFQIKIFDTWGNLVFFSSDKYFTWDGNLRGTPCPEGVYMYVISATGFEEQSIHKNGTITLIR